MIATYTLSIKNAYDLFLADCYARIRTLSKQFEVVLKPLVQLIILLPLTEGAETQLFSITLIIYSYDSETKTSTPSEIKPRYFYVDRLLTGNLPDIRVTNSSIG
jgi:hypothetical protein